MFAALYGELVSHDWRDPELDAYSLFYHRSLAMGWLDDTGTGGGSQEWMVRASGLWGMNDAGWNPVAGDGTALVSWFQVTASAVADDRPLPVQPFLQCAVHATERAGSLNLSAVQVLLPVHGLALASRPPWARVPAMRTIPWFSGRAPETRTPVEVAISGDQNTSLSAVAPQLTDNLARLEQDVFTGGSREIERRNEIPAPPFDDDLWDGPLDGVVLRGELVEWSCDAIGWLAEVVADSAAELHLRSPLLLTVTRTLPIS